MIQNILKILFFVVLFGFSLSSCATVFNWKDTKIKVYSDVDSAKICINRDTTKWYITPADITVPRSENDLLITARKDSLEKEFSISAFNIPNFCLDNFCIPTGILANLPELLGSIRFNYPEEITLKLNDKGKFDGRNRYSLGKPKTRNTKIPDDSNNNKWEKPKKGMNSIKLSLYEGNNLYINTGNSHKNAWGFMLGSFVLEHYFSDNFCLSSEIGFITDFFVPFPAPVDELGSYEHSSASLINLMFGGNFGKNSRLHYDLGLQYNYSIFNKFTEDTTIKPNPGIYQRKEQNNFGLAVKTYFWVTEYFNLGISYYPSFIAIDNKVRYQYSHLLFIELAFRINFYL